MTRRRQSSLSASKARPKIGPAPLKGYEQITRLEEADLKRLSVKEAIARLEILLRMASNWRR